jgi:hypothetical protein
VWPAAALVNLDPPRRLVAGVARHRAGPDRHAASVVVAVKIRIVFTSDALNSAEVRGVPSLCDRLLGRRELDAVAVLAGSLWIWDATGEPIADRAVLRAIDQARQRAAREPRHAN